MGVAVAATQFGDPSEPFCSRLNPVEGKGQETRTELLVVTETDKSGAPGVCTVPIRLRNRL
jgi:hypothetical protein